MTHIYPDFTYGPGPRDGCWWERTCDTPHFDPLVESATADVAIIGAGFTGLNAALELAGAGRNVVVLEARRVGWGASGRNGGFCCLGGGIASDKWLDRTFGRAARLEWRRTEIASIETVDRFITDERIDVDRHSEGETQLAHNSRSYDAVQREKEAFHENYGMEPAFHPREELAQMGLNGPFFGARTVPFGFGLNPAKYVSALARKAVDSGSRIFADSPVATLARSGDVWELRTKTGSVQAENVVVATNGYSSETLPSWLSGRYLPTQSNVMVTRPLTGEELHAQGWTSRQMAYDSRNLLHYFRLMPDNRFLFGARGGILSSPAAERSARARLRRHFERMFPAWRHVEIVGQWSGMVSLARNGLPYVGPVPGAPGLWTSLCYHGNGVAMGSHAGRLVARSILGTAEVPRALREPLSRIPLGRFRRLLIPLAYAQRALADI